MSDINTFEDLEVWKRRCQLAVDVYVANHASKDFGLRDQMQRATVSIPPNIAEGCERDSTPDFIKFLRYSKGSCGELRTQLYISDRVRKKNQPRNSPKCSKVSSTPSNAAPSLKLLPLL